MTTQNEDKEIDRILRIVEKLSSVEAKFDSFSKECIRREDATAAQLKSLTERLSKIEIEGTNVLRKEVSEIKESNKKNDEELVTLKELFVELKDKSDRLKWVLGTVALVISPAVTALVIAVIRQLCGI
jgi:septation ring formation regulator EzrA